MLRIKRQFFLLFHRYLGLIFGFLFILISITGSFLVFSEEIDHFFHPHLLQVEHQGQPLLPQKVVEIVQNAYGGLKPHRITVPQEPSQVYTVMMVSSEDEYTDIYVNPYTGDILGTRPWKQTPIGFLIDLHVHLLSGDWGMQLVGATGIALLGISFTGLVLWNGWFRLRRSLRVRWRSPKPLLIYDLHRVTGVLAVIWLTLIAFTGVTMIFWTPFENTVYWLVGETKPLEVTSQMVDNRPPMAIDEILSKAHAAFPKAVLWKFYPAKKPQDTFDVWLLFPKENAFNKDVYLSLDQYTGDILKARNAQEDSLAKRIIYSQYTLHTGQYGGWLIRWLYGIIGFVPLGLLITGLIWLREKYRSSRQNNHAHQ